MTNKNLSIIFVLFILLLSSCNSSKKSEEVASYTYKEETPEMSEAFKAQMPDWLEEGKICYGLVVQVDNETNKPVKGKPVKAKIVQINTDYVKMKALEKVSLVEVEGCDKMGISKGQTWDEKTGDFYLTKEEAIEALQKLNIYTVKKNDRVTVD